MKKTISIIIVIILIISSFPTLIIFSDKKEQQKQISFESNKDSISAVEDCGCNIIGDNFYNNQNENENPFGSNNEEEFLQMSEEIYEILYGEGFDENNLAYIIDEHVNSYGSYQGQNPIGETFDLFVYQSINIDFDMQIYSYLFPLEYYYYIVQDTQDMKPFVTVNFATMSTSQTNSVNVVAIVYGWKILSTNEAVGELFPIANIDSIIYQLNTPNLPYGYNFTIADILVNPFQSDQEDTDDFDEGPKICFICALREHNPVPIVVCPEDPEWAPFFENVEDIYEICRQEAWVEFLACITECLVGEIDDILDGKIEDIAWKLLRILCSRFLNKQTCKKLTQIQDINDLIDALKKLLSIDTLYKLIPGWDCIECPFAYHKAVKQCKLNRLKNTGLVVRAICMGDYQLFPTIV